MAVLPRQLVAETLRHRIASGQLVAGQRLPTELTLAEEFSVSRETVRHALQILAKQGAVVLQRGVGCFVPADVKQEEQSEIVFLHPLTEWPNVQTYSGMELRAAELGYELCLRQLPAEKKAALQIVEKLRRNRVRGVIFTPFIEPNYYDINNRLLDLFEQCDLRYVVVDTPIACNGVLRGDFVGSNGYTAMREIVRTLIALGHRRIGSIRVFAGVYSGDQRFRGIVEELNAHGIPIEPELHRVIDNVPLPEQGRRQIRDILTLPEPPTAIIASHDNLVLNLFDELRRMGRSIPEDLSFFGFDDLYFTEPLGLSTVKQPWKVIGYRAVELLLTPSTARRQEFFPCEVIIRNSVSQHHSTQEVKK